MRPYILRRLKTDKRVIADLPDKTEVKAYCALSKHQAALYQKAVDDLAEQLEASRRHPAAGDRPGPADAAEADLQPPRPGGRHGRLRRPTAAASFAGWRRSPRRSRRGRRRCSSSRSSARSPTRWPEFLATLFGRPGLVLHGGTSVKKRKEFVDQFQREDGPPFFVLSLKAGGTGLNLTAASHVIHFDRWWNPAVENQATDRAFRIGQKKNVLVHKFICRGTVEERIDEMIAQKSGLARDLLEGAAANNC